MILGNFRHWVLGALLAAIALPTLAAEPEQRPTALEAPPPAPARSQSADASRSRRVELPFPLDLRSPHPEPRASSPEPGSEPHPFRETLLKRASLVESGVDGIRVRGLSPHRELV